MRSCVLNLREHVAKKFTLIELMVVLSIIAILMGLLIPALNMAKSLTKQAGCVNNMKQIGLLYSNHSEDYNGYLPASYINEYGNYWSNVLYSLYIHENGLKPIGFVGGKQEYVDRLGHHDQGVKYEEGTIFHCPDALKRQRASDAVPRKYYSSYVANENLAGNSFRSPTHITDVELPSSGYLAMDCNVSVIMGWWVFGYAAHRPFMNAQKHHNYGRNLLFVDGHVGYLENIDFPAYGDLTQRAEFWQGIRR